MNCRFAFAVLAIAAAVMGTAASVRAGDNAKAAEAVKVDREIVVNPGAAVGAGQGFGISGGKDYIKYLETVVSLTDEQKQRIEEIVAQRGKDVTDFQAKIADKARAASEAMVAAYKSKDQDAIAKAQADYQAIYAPMQQIMKKSNDALESVLTKEQKGQIKDAQLMRYIKEAATPAKLTEQQIKAVKSAVNQGDDQGIDYVALREAVDNILTPEQKATITKSRAMWALKTRFWVAKLSEEQMQQLDAAANQLGKDPNLSQAEFTEKLAEKANSLLTPEQRAAMEKAGKAGEVWGAR